jgi:hypothetical protein
MARRRCMAVLAALLLVPAAQGEPLPAQGVDSVDVSRQTAWLGLRSLSSQRVARLFGEGARDGAAWDAQRDSLVALCGEAGRPLAAVAAHGGRSGRTWRLDSVRVEEGPLLVMGGLRLDPPTPGLPDPDLDLPPGRTLSQGRLREGLTAWLGRLEAQGRPLARLVLDELDLRPMDDATPPRKLALHLRGHLADADTIRPGGLVVLSPGLTRPVTFQRLTRLPDGAAWDPRRVAEARRRLLATGWFSTLTGPELGRREEGWTYWLRAVERPSFQFDGMLGWLPGRSGQGGRLAYHLELALANLAGTGRELKVLASRPEGWSQQLRLDYREPFLRRWPVDWGGHLRQKVQDSTWVELEAGLAVGWEPVPGWRLEASGLLQELSPDSLNGYRLAGLDASRARRGSLALRADRRDDPRNPRRGWQALLEESWIRRSYGSLSGLPPRATDLELRRRALRGSAWLPLGGARVLALAAGAGRFEGQAPGVEDEFRLGGQEGPRGWREESLRARSWALLQVEGRLLLGPAARTGLFWDGLLWEDAEETRRLARGWGGLLVLPVPQGQLDLQYALQPGQAWREGLLHVRLLTRF